MLVYRDGRRKTGVKWHILSYAGIFSPAKVVNIVVKLKGRPLGEQPNHYILSALSNSCI